MVPHGRLKQEDCKFEVNLGYTARAISKKNKVLGAGEMAQLMKCLLCKLKVLSSIPTTHLRSQEWWPACTCKRALENQDKNNEEKRWGIMETTSHPSLPHSGKTFFCCILIMGTD